MGKTKKRVIKFFSVASVMILTTGTTAIAANSTGKVDYGEVVFDADDILNNETAIKTIENNVDHLRGLNPDNITFTFSDGVFYMDGVPSGTIGNAVNGDVLQGYSFSSAIVGIKGIGTIKNHGNTSFTNQVLGSTISIPEGYYDGTGKIVPQSLASQTQGTATANDILEGEIAMVNGVPVKGNIPNKTNAVSPKFLYSTQSRPSDNENIAASGKPYYDKVSIPKGYQDGTVKIEVETLARQTPGNVTADKQLNGYTSWSNGVKITGSMQDNKRNTSEAKTDHSVINAKIQNQVCNMPAGYYNQERLREIYEKGIADVRSTAVIEVYYTDGSGDHVVYSIKNDGSIVSSNNKTSADGKTLYSRVVYKKN